MSLQYRRPQLLDSISLDRHCVIEASAGTGKTFTLEHLILEILLKSTARIDQILAVTFTERATADLRKRIRSTIEAALRGALADDESIGPLLPLNEAQRERLEDALFSFERAPVHTIHSFCRRMLSELAFFSAARFRLEVADARTLFHEAFRAELREHFALDEWTARLLEEWLAEQGPETDRLEVLLFRAHERRYIASGAAARNEQAGLLLMEKFDAGQLTKELRRAGANSAVTTSLSVLEDTIRSCGHDFWALRRSLQIFGSGKIAAWARNPKVSEHAREILRALAAVQACAGLEARAVDGFLPSIELRLARTKRERGIVDFDDMPGWLWEGLEGPQGRDLVSTLRERFRFGLVDEFQDTDDLQWRIFRRIFVEGDGDNRLFLIGDPKQAIYAFRDADVFTYLGARRELTETYKAAIVPLTQNFRSTQAMLDAINLTFAPEPPDQFFAEGEIRYEHPLVCGRPQMRARNQNGRPVTPIALLRLREGAKLSARRYRAIIGRRIAAELADLLHGRDAIEIDSEGPTRTVSARNIFVLTRTLAESREIAGYLRQAGVPCAFYKQDGLFETREAGHVLDTLRAVAAPDHRSNRLKAWSTPLFGVRLRELPGLDGVSPTHPLMVRLMGWKKLGDEERFAELFAAMLHQSGIVARELLLAGSPRELTNYEHIFEILLERAIADRLSLSQLVEMLAGWVDGGKLPSGENPGVQRLESDRDAVQIMTVHKSKGLEADVVAVFGGFARGNQVDSVSVFHPEGARTVVVGKEGRTAFKAEIEKEEKAEEERLLYVALTRARARLYLAMFPEESTKQELNGYYKHLNLRLLALELSPRASGLFEIKDLSDTIAGPAQASNDVQALVRAWRSPEVLMDDEGDSELLRRRAALIASHSPLSIYSYTSLQRLAPMREGIEAGQLKADFEEEADEVTTSEDLPRGSATGMFLHEAIEQIDLDAIAKARDVEDWLADGRARTIIASAARRHGVPDAWIDRGAEIIFNALRSPLVLGDETVKALADCPAKREMEFTFSIPSNIQPLLGEPGGQQWTIDRGLLVGYIDLVFRSSNRTFFADWKSDLLPSYEPAAVASHVADRYLMQAEIYTLGVVRLLRIQNERDYARQFGGLVYIFLRGIRPDGEGRAGVYFHRPEWREVVAYEQALKSVGR